MSVQNMHLMTTSLEQVGGYWSSFNWCRSARDSHGRFVVSWNTRKKIKPTFDNLFSYLFYARIEKIFKKLKSDEVFLSWQQDRTANLAHTEVLFCLGLICSQKTILGQLFLGWKKSFFFFFSTCADSKK